jgi:hypothetical protein
MADAAPMDDDTTATSGEVDPQDVADAQADNAQTSTTDRGRATAERLLTEGENMASGKDPAQASLIAQYGLNAQQARAILQRARDTLAQNAPQMINLAAAQHMSNPGGWGQIYAGSMGAAANAQQDINKQLAGYDLSMVQAGQGGLDAQLKMLTNRLAFYDKVAPAAMRVEGLPPVPAAKAPSGEAQNYEQLLKDSLTAQGLQEGTPEYQQQYSHGLKAFLAKQQHFTDPEQALSMFTPKGGKPGAAAISGDDYLSQLDPSIAAQVKALAEGRMQFPSGFALKTPYWQGMLSAVSQYDPTFDQANYGARSKTRNAFTSGKDSDVTSRMNTAIGHLGTLYDQIGGTASHSGFPFATTVNAAQNWMSTSAGNPGVPLFKDTAGKLAQELTAVYRGSGGAESDVVRSLESLDPNASLETKQAVLKNAVDLLKSKLDAQTVKYNNGMGTTDQPIPMLSAHAQDVLDRVSMGKPSPAAARGSLPATQPKYQEGQTATGPSGKMIYHAATGWTPLAPPNAPTAGASSGR